MDKRKAEVGIKVMKQKVMYRIVGIKVKERILKVIKIYKKTQIRTLIQYPWLLIITTYRNHLKTYYTPPLNKDKEQKARIQPKTADKRISRLLHLLVKRKRSLFREIPTISKN